MTEPMTPTTQAALSEEMKPQSVIASELTFQYGIRPFMAEEWARGIIARLGETGFVIARAEGCPTPEADADLLQPSTLAEALRDVMHQALAAKAALDASGGVGGSEHQDPTPMPIGGA